MPRDRSGKAALQPPQQGRSRPQDTVLVDAEALLRQRALRHAMEMLERRLARPAYGKCACRPLACPIEDDFQLRPVVHLLERHHLNRRARDDHAVEALAGDLFGAFVQAYPRYGSEKKGLPTAYFLTIAEERVRTHAELDRVDFVPVHDVAAFHQVAPLRGLVGVASYGKNDFYNNPPWKHTTGSEFDVKGVTKLPRVDIIFADLDMGPELIDAAATGAKGIVIAGVGNGNMTKAALEAAARAAKKGVVVVRSSRVATGLVGRNVEVNDDELNLIASDELNPQKSRVLLSLALLKSHRSPEKIQTMFGTY